MRAIASCCLPVWTTRSLRSYWSSALHVRRQLPDRAECQQTPSKTAPPRTAPACRLQIRRSSTAPAALAPLQAVDARTVGEFVRQAPLSCSTLDLHRIVAALGLQRPGSATSLAVAVGTSGHGQFVESLLGLEIARAGGGDGDDDDTVCWRIAEMTSPHEAVFNLAAWSAPFTMRLYQSFRRVSTLHALTDRQLACGLELVMRARDPALLDEVLRNHSLNLGQRLGTASDPAACRSLLALLSTLAFAPPGRRRLAVDAEPQLLADLYGALARLLPEVDVRDYLADALLCRNAAEAVCRLRVPHTALLDAFREHVELVTPEEDFWSPSYAGNVLYLYAWMGAPPAASLLQLWRRCYDSLPEDSTRFATAMPVVLARLCWSFVAAGDDHDDVDGGRGVPRWVAAATGRSLDAALRRSDVDWHSAELLAQCVRSVAPFMHAAADDDADDDVIERLEARVRDFAVAGKLWARELTSRSSVRYASGVFHVLVAADGGEPLPWPTGWDPADMTPSVATSLDGDCGGRPVALLLHPLHLFLRDGTPSGVLARRRRMLEERGWLVACVPLSKEASRDVVLACRNAIAVAAAAALR